MNLLKRLLWFVLFLPLLNSVAFSQEEVSITNVSAWVKATNSKGEPVHGLKATELHRL